MLDDSNHMVDSLRTITCGIDRSADRDAHRICPARIAEKYSQRAVNGDWQNSLAAHHCHRRDSRDFIRLHHLHWNAQGLVQHWDIPARLIVTHHDVVFVLLYVLASSHLQAYASLLQHPL